MRRIAIFISTTGYVGLFPFAPGTAGSLVGVALYVLLGLDDSMLAEMMTVLLIGTLGIWASGIAEDHFRCIDPGPVTIDEVFGMLISLAMLDVGWSGLVLAFLLFRFFDVVKIYPSAKLERIEGGVGIMADDALAGLYTNITLRMVLWFFPRWLV